MVIRSRIALAVAALAATFGSAPASANPSDAPLARFEGAVCPGVAGLARADAEVVVGRIRENLEALGRRLAPEGTCKANLIVAFVADPQGYIDRVRTNEPWYFTDMPPRERERVLAETGPARALLRVEARNRDGQPVADRENLVDVPQTTMWMAHSKIYTATRNDITSALVLIQRDEARHRTIMQLADYATFRALTRALPETAEARSQSILGLFDGAAESPAGLTAFDTAFLGTLYDGMPNIPGEMRELALEQATGVDVFNR